MRLMRRYLETCRYRSASAGQQRSFDRRIRKLSSNLHNTFKKLLRSRVILTVWPVGAKTHSYSTRLSAMIVV